MFRGLTVAGMLLVNDPGTWSAIYPPLRHADWHGWTPTDLIFPFFLFIVGITTQLSISARRERGDDERAITRQIFKRGALMDAPARSAEPPPADRPASASERIPRRADVTAAVILDPEMATRFDREWRQVELERQAWRAQLEAHPPDLLLAQVPGGGEGSAWRLTSASRADLEAVAEAVAWCREHRIPTALWSTAERGGLEEALPAARLFDQVFSVDRDSVPRYREALGHERVVELAAFADPISMLAATRARGAPSSTPPDPRDLLAHRELRAALDADTPGHRVDEILRAVGIEVDERCPAVSITLSTVRESQIDHVIEAAARQRWRPLQLVLVLHGLDLDPEAIATRARRAGIDDVVVIAGERSWTLGGCLNAALERAEGDLVQKMDDDDLYGVHFVGDLARAFSYADASVVGKLAQYVHLERSGATMLRWPYAEHSFVRAVHGGTILVRADVLRELRWTDTTVPADTFLLRDVRNAGGGIYSADRFSFVYVRRGHGHGHVWTLSDAAVIRSSTRPAYGPPDPYLLG